jgi:hypothetical protein
VRCIESPGNDFDVWRELLALGAAARAREPGFVVAEDAARALSFEQGRLRHVRQWFLGLIQVLGTIELMLSRSGATSIGNSPAAVRLCFDKAAVHEVLAAHKVARPERLSDARCYDELKTSMATRGLSQVFVKPRHGSTACGVVALRAARGRVVATSTVEPVLIEGEWRFFSSFRVRRVTREHDVARILDFVLAEGAVIERWIPKLTIGSEAVDVRVMVLGKQAFHTVARGSTTPITNLHSATDASTRRWCRQRVYEPAWQRGTWPPDACVAFGCLLGRGPVVRRFAASFRGFEVNAFAISCRGFCMPAGHVGHADRGL